VREWFAWAWEALAEVEHPNLPDVRSVGRQGEVPFAVREPIEGRRLPQLLGNGERVDPGAMRILICRMADGLERAHEAGVIHGAIGPEDLVLEPEARTGATGRWVGFGRVEGLRSDDIRGLGSVLESLLENERRTREPEEESEAGAATMDGAIIAMLTRVSEGARDGEFKTAGEFRDVVAAGTEPRRGWRRLSRFFSGGES
jgi:serine/threonine protein kinase